MVLQASGAISLSQIAAEFGDTAPHRLGEFYRGGGLVNENANSEGIPASGVISFSDFYGKAHAPAVIPPLNVAHNRRVQLRFRRDGSIQGFEGGTLRYTRSWVDAVPGVSATPTVGDDFEAVRLSRDVNRSTASGSPQPFGIVDTGGSSEINSSGAVIDEDLDNIVTASVGFAFTVAIARWSVETIGIRRVGTTTILAQGVFTLTLDVQDETSAAG